MVKRIQEAFDVFDIWKGKVREHIFRNFVPGEHKYPIRIDGKTSIEIDPGLVCYGCAHMASNAPFPGHPSGESACMTCIRNPERVGQIHPEDRLPHLKSFEEKPERDNYLSLNMFQDLVDLAKNNTELRRDLAVVQDQVKVLAERKGYPWDDSSNS